MKIVVLDGHTLNPGDLSWEGFEKLGDFICYDHTPAGEIVERIGDAEAIILNKTPITAETLDACPGIRYIGVLATGYNVVDAAAARQRGVPVANVPAYSTAAVAQFTFALLLEVCHNVGSHAEGVRNGRWTRSRDFAYWDHPLIELDGKTLGIVGFGSIGRAVAKIAVALGMNVLANARRPGPSLEGNGVRYAGLDELLAEADAVSLHVPLTDVTRGMINALSIAKMRDGVIVVNTARGPIVVEEDMRAALESGKVSAYAADVVSVEPILESNPLLRAPNCYLTPHIAWAPKETRARLMDMAAANLAAFAAGKPINVVNG